MSTAATQSPDPGKAQVLSPTYQESVTGSKEAPKATSGGSTPASTSGGGGPDPAEELKQAESDLAEAQELLATLQAKVLTLKGPVSEIEKIVKAYEAGLPKITAEKNLLTELFTQHKAEVEAVLGEKAEKVREKVNEVDAKIAYLRTRAADDEGKYKELQAAADTANGETAQAEQEFKEAKQTLASTESRLKAARAIKEQEAKADAENDHKRKTFLLQDLEASLNGLALPQPDELQDKLNAALNAVKAKKEAHVEAVAAAKASKKTSGESKTVADAAAASRTADILKAIADI